jgi:hypothetical protein
MRRKLGELFFRTCAWIEARKRVTFPVMIVTFAIFAGLFIFLTYRLVNSGTAGCFLPGAACATGACR